MVEVEVSDMGNGRNLFRKPKPSMSEIHQMTEGTEYSPVRDHSWKKGTLEGLRLNQKLEKGLMEDGEEARILKFQGREREVLTQSGHKRGSQKSSKKKWDNSSISQEVPQEGATYLSWAAQDNMGQIHFLHWTL